MHTQFKRKHGETVAEGFCPLDLYSGDPQRMRSAIARLWDIWKASDDDAIRNLRVFFDGKTADPRDVSFFSLSVRLDPSDNMDHDSPAQSSVFHSGCWSTRSDPSRQRTLSPQWSWSV